MTIFRQNAETVAAEISAVLARIDEEQIESVVAALNSAQRVFVIGVGREGLSSRAFAMRLMHLGLTVHVGWDDTTPNIGPGDLLVMVNGSGRIGHLDYVFTRAQVAGADTLVVTGVPDAPTPAAATLSLQVPATVYLGQGDLVESIQPMGSLFEQSLLIVFDLIVLQLAASRQQSFAQMAVRHRNFE